MSFSYSTLRPLPYTTLFRPSRSAGRNCGVRIYSRPSSLWKPYFAPRMRVCLSHEKEMSQIVMLTAQISDDHPRRNSCQSHQSSETGGVVFAKTGSPVKEKLFQVVLSVFAW